MMRDDMADYFARLRAAHAPAPPVAAVAVPPVPPVLGFIRSGPASSGKAKRQKQMTLI